MSKSVFTTKQVSGGFVAYFVTGQKRREFEIATLKNGKLRFRTHYTKYLNGLNDAGIISWEKVSVMTDKGNRKFSVTMAADTEWLAALESNVAKVEIGITDTHIKMVR